MDHSYPVKCIKRSVSFEGTTVTVSRQYEDGVVASSHSFSFSHSLNCLMFQSTSEEYKEDFFSLFCILISNS